MDGPVGQYGLPLATAAASAASPRYGAPAAQALWSGMALGEDAKNKRTQFDAERRQRNQFEEQSGNYVADLVNSGKMSSQDAQLVDMMQNRGDQAGITKFLESIAQGKSLQDMLTPYDQAVGAQVPPGTKATFKTPKGEVVREGGPITPKAPRGVQVHPYGFGQVLEVDDAGNRKVVKIPTDPRAVEKPEAREPGKRMPNPTILQMIAGGTAVPGFEWISSDQAQKALDAAAAGKGNPLDRAIAEKISGTNKGPNVGGSGAAKKKADPSDPAGIR